MAGTSNLSAKPPVETKFCHDSLLDELRVGDTVSTLDEYGGPPIMVPEPKVAKDTTEPLGLQPFALVTPLNFLVVKGLISRPFDRTRDSQNVRKFTRKTSEISESFRNRSHRAQYWYEGWVRHMIIDLEAQIVSRNLGAWCNRRTRDDTVCSRNCPVSMSIGQVLLAA